MAKESKDKLSETSPEGAPLQKLVSVEMTEEEMKKVTSFLAKEKEESLRKEEKEPVVEVNLRFGHAINGVKYGPGRVRVPALLGSTLYGNDLKAFEAELNVSQNNKHMIEIIQGGPAIIRKVG